MGNFKISDYVTVINPPFCSFRKGYISDLFKVKDGRLFATITCVKSDNSKMEKDFHISINNLKKLAGRLI